MDALLAPCNRGPSYGVLTFRSLSHKSEWIIVTLAPVSTNALTKMPSTDTDSKFDGCSGGICVVPIDAVFPQKTAWSSFPSGGYHRAQRDVGVKPNGGTEREIGAETREYFEEHQQNQQEAGNDVSETGRLVVGN